MLSVNINLCILALKVSVKVNKNCRLRSIIQIRTRSEVWIRTSAIFASKVHTNYSQRHPAAHIGYYLRDNVNCKYSSDILLAVGTSQTNEQACEQELGMNKS